MEQISLSDTRHLIDSIDPYGFPVGFSIAFWTLDVQRGTGGELVTIDYAVKNFALERANKNKKFKIKSNTVVSQNKEVSRLQEQHAQEQTTVIAVMSKNELTGRLEPTGKRITIHYRLIETINNKKVVW